jgi:YD repeat-containing protein
MSDQELSVRYSRPLGRHILIVDDEPAVRDVVQRMLEAAGYDVRTARDAHSALQSIADVKPAVALCDIHMPGPSGLWLADQIRASSPMTSIVLATSDDALPPAETLRSPIVAYILKPLQRRAVLATVADAFREFAAKTGVDVTPVPITPPATTGAEVPRPASRRSRSIGRWFFVLVAAALIASLFGVYRTWLGERPAQVFSQVAGSSGVVIVEDASGNSLAQGSGFFVAEDLFVTNHHVVNGAAIAKVMTNEGVVIPVRGLVANDRLHDVVLLKTSLSSSRHLALATSRPAVGDDVWVFGAPLGLQGTLSKGIVSAERTEGLPLLQISAPISPGSSGSPVVNTRGDVVGVASAVRMEGQNLNFAVPASYVQHLLDTAADVRPLIAAARGAGDDLERNQLIGPIRMVTVFGDSRAVLIFDRKGRLIEHTLDDGVTRSQYEYDETGHLKTVVERVNDRIVNEWNFTQVGHNVFEGRSREPRDSSMRRLEYSDEGRLVLDQKRTADAVMTSLRWMYPEAGWPATSITPREISDSGSGPAHEEYDAIGNTTRRRNGDGTETRFEYVFDRRANWTSRETIRVDAKGVPTVVTRERRDIQYW